MKNIIFIGMAGCGKTTFSKLISEKLNKNFIDTDEIIIERAKMTIEKIFEIHGEKYFRDLETEIIKEVANSKDSIISTGGGVILRKENITELKKNGIIIYIERDIEDIINNLDTNNRPLMKGSEDSIRELFKKRKNIYEESSDFTITNNADIDIITEKILEIIENEN